MKMNTYFKQENRLLKIPKGLKKYLNPRYNPQIKFIDKNNAEIRFNNSNKILKLKIVNLKKKVDVNVSNDGVKYFKSGEIKQMLMVNKELNNVNIHTNNSVRNNSVRLFKKDVQNVIETKLTKEESNEILRVLPLLQDIEKNI